MKYRAINIRFNGKLCRAVEDIGGSRLIMACDVAVSMGRSRPALKECIKDYAVVVSPEDVNDYVALRTRRHPLFITVEQAEELVGRPPFIRAYAQRQSPKTRSTRTPQKKSFLKRILGLFR